MSRLGTILLVFLAIAAGVFLFVVEPRMKSTRQTEATRDFALQFDPTEIRELRVRSGQQEFELTRNDDGWWVGPRPKDRVSFQLVNDIVTAAQNLQVHDIIRAEEFHGDLDLDDFDLEKPKYQLDLIGDGQATLYFGKEAAGEGRMYVRKADSSDVLVVDDALRKLVFRDPQEMRDRRLTNLSPEQIDRFTIKRGAGEIEVARVGRNWELIRPLHAAADTLAVEGLLQKLLGMEILKFVADESNDLSAYGFAEPRGELVLQIDGRSRPSALRIGADAGPAVLAQYTARDSVYELPADAWELLQATPEDLRDRRLLPLNLDAVDAIRYRNGDVKWMLERAGDDWKAGDRVLGDAAVEKTADAFASTKVKEYLPVTAENLKKTGLDAPVEEIAFDAWLSENTPEAVAGRHPVASVLIGRTEGEDAYVRIGEDPEICVIDAQAVTAWPGTPEALGD